MKQARTFKGIIILLIVVLSAAQANAGIIHAFQRIETVYPGGAPVVANTATARSVVNVPMAAGTYRTIKNTIRFGVNHDYPQYLDQAMDIEISFELEYDLEPPIPGIFRTLPTGTQVLTIRYDPMNPTANVDEAVLNFTGCMNMIVQITQVKVDGIIVSTLPANLYVDNEISVERYEAFATPATALSFGPKSAKDINQDLVNDLLRIGWNPRAGVEEYQLEWTYVNDYTDLHNGLLGEQYYNFKENSTRITTTNNFYEIPLVFDRGILIYRVRGIGYDLSDLNKYITGVWNLPEQDLLSSLSTTNSHTITADHAHQKDLNWEYAITFAEEGKRKEVISYYDGSLRNRQSVTKINTDESVIVGETIYDYNGRPAVQILPVPTENPVGPIEPALGYYPGFNQNTAGQTYSKKDFDEDKILGTCQTENAGMGTGNGAGQYYSGNNQDKNGAQAYVPDATDPTNTAKAFPYSQVEYTPDNTGRIRQQGGVGKEFQLEGEHKTKYYYGQPNQLELDRLFGPEVGYAAHYKKNVVEDPNGQISISYLDQEGRVVATVLAGVEPENLKAIPSATASAVWLNVNAFGDGAQAQNKINESEDGFTLSTQLLVGFESNYTFSYDLTVPAFTDPCLPNVCLDCVYDLNIELIDECGTNHLNNFTQTLVGNFALDGGEYVFHANSTCGADYNMSDYIETVAHLGIGNYSLNKTLRINKEAREAYIQKYLNGAADECLKTQEEFEQEAIAAIDESNCNVSCDNCYDKLGTLAEYLATNQGTVAMYRERAADCERACAGEVFRPCDVASELMKMDMRPGGQYAQYPKSGTDFTAYPLSVLNSDNILPNVEAFWKNPMYLLPTDEVQPSTGPVYAYESMYYDDAGNPARIELTPNPTTDYLPLITDLSKVIVEDGKFYIYPQYLAEVNDFISHFEHSWTKSLLPYHPEYSYYITCLEYTKKSAATDTYTSQSYDELLQKTETMAEAVTLNLMQGTLTTNYTVKDMLSADPFYDNDSQFTSNQASRTSLGDRHCTENFSSNNSNGATSLAWRFNNYQSYTDDPTQTISLFQMAVYMTKCAKYGYMSAVPFNPTGDCFNATDLTLEQADEVWQRFKSLYLSLKAEMQRERADCIAQASEQGHYNNCIGNTDFDPLENEFLNTLNTAANYINSGYLDQAQICSYPTAAYYASKQSRFPDESVVPNIDPQAVAYQMYLQNGQCPKTLALQELLNAIAGTEGMTVSPRNIVQYPQLFNWYNALNDFSYAGPLPSTAMYQATGSGNDLNITLTVDADVFNINLHKTDSHNWADITQIVNLYGTGTNQFSLDAVYVEAGENKSFGVSGTITNNTIGIDVENCTFEQQCELNEFGRDLNTLMQTLVNEFPLKFRSTTAENLVFTLQTGAPGILTQTLKDVLRLGDNLTWRYDATLTRFVLNGGTSHKNVYITINNPEALNGGNITSFDEIRPTEGNTFHILAKVSGQAQPLDLYCDIILNNNGEKSRLAVGICELPMAQKCSDPEYSNYNELKRVLNDLLVVQNNDFNTPINFFASTQLSDRLAAAMGIESPFMSSLIRNGQNEILTFGSFGQNCITTLKVINEFSGSVFNNITEIISFNVIYSDEFTSIISMVVRSDGAIKNVTVTTCIPVRKCSECAESALLTEEEVPEEESFLLLTNAVNEFNSSNSLSEGDANFVTSMSFERFAASGMAHSTNSYIRYLKQFQAGVDQTAQAQNPLQFAAQYGYGVNAAAEYQRYQTAITQHNLRAAQQSATALTALTETAFLNGRFADRNNEYVSYLQGRPIAGETTQEITNFLNPATEGTAAEQANYAQYVQAYQTLKLELATSGNCPEFAQLTPLYSFEEVQSRNLFCSTTTGSYLDSYITELQNADACVGDLPYATTCETGQLKEKKANLHRMFVLYQQGITEYNQSEFAQVNSHQLEMEINSFQELEQNYKSTCIRNYLGHLDHFTRLEGPPTPERPLPIREFSGCFTPKTMPDTTGQDKTVTDPTNQFEICLQSLTDWISANNNEFAAQILIQRYAGITSEIRDYPRLYGFCVDEFCSRINDVIDGIVPMGEFFTSYLDPAFYCPPTITPPCEPEPTHDIPPSEPEPTIPPTDNCHQLLVNAAMQNAQNAYRNYIDERYNELRQRYNQHCMQAKETMSYRFEDKMYHYTLYYYDQAGNLIKTIPPEGVELLPLTDNTSSLPTDLNNRISNDRQKGTQSVFTTHRMASRYEYNSLNQLIAQSVPDADPIDDFELSLPNGLHPKFEATRVQMIDATNGYMSGKVGNFGFLYRTSDGGATWTRCTNIVAADLKKVRMYDANIGFAIGEAGTVLVTHNAGAKWNMLQSWQTAVGANLSDFNDLHLSNGGTNKVRVMLVGDNRTITRLTYDYSAKTETWSNQLTNIPTVTSPITKLDVTSITADASNYYITVNETQGSDVNGKMYWSPLIGSTLSWTALTMGTGTNNDITSTGSSIYMAGNDGRIYKRPAGDLTANWKLIANNLSDPITKIRYFDDEQGYALVQQGLDKHLYRTIDGGKNWEQATSFPYNDLTMDYNRKIMLAVGPSGRMDLLAKAALVTEPVEPGQIPFSNTTANISKAFVYAEAIGSIRTIVVLDNNSTYYSPNLAATDPVWTKTIETGSQIVQIEGNNSTTKGIFGVVRRADNSAQSFKLDADHKIGYTNLPGNGSYTLLTANGSSPDKFYVYDATTSKMKTISFNLTNLVVTATVTNTITGYGAATALTIQNGRAYLTNSASKNIGFTLLGTTGTPIQTTLAKANQASLYTVQTDGTKVVAAGADGQVFAITITSGTPEAALQKTGFSEQINEIGVLGTALIAVGNASLLRTGSLAANVYSSTEVLNSNEKLQLSGTDFTALALKTATAYYVAGTTGKVVQVQAAQRKILNLNGSNLQGICYNGTDLLTVGQDLALYSIQGGSYIKQKEIYGFTLVDVHFADANNGSILGEHHFVRNTTDGGQTWNIIKATSTTTAAIDFNRVYTHNSKLTLLLGNTVIYKAENGIDNRITSLTGLKNITEFAKHPLTKELYVGGSTGASTDISKLTITESTGGFSFSQSLGVNIPGVSVIDALQVFENGGYAAITSHQVFRFYSAGNAQTFSYTLPSKLNDMAFFGLSRGVIVGDDGKYYHVKDIELDANGNITNAVFEAQAKIYTADPHLVTTTSDADLVSVSLGSYETAVVAGNYTSSTLNNAANYPYVRRVYDPMGRYTSRFYYDRLGRLIVSQNARQANGTEKKYSYTKYDELGRVTEVGEKTENSGSAIKFIAIFGTSVSDYYNPKMIDDTRYGTWIDGPGNRREVTRSYYSNEDLTSLPSEYIINPSTARNRITSVTYAETWTLDDNQYDHATHYMYDIHGNVSTLFQDNKKLAVEIPTLATEQIKRIDYRYDLISGNVHRVSVQAGKADQWHHAYLYDADNRIEAAYTNSSTPTLSLKASSAALQNELVMNADWENDARYFYYDHGPLSRVELGEENIQGMDYVYNLQGWLKGVNSTFLHTNKDPGADGAFASSFPKDVMSFSLNYFSNDYTPIDGAKTGTNSFQASIAGSAAESNSSSFELFNGNIRAMQTTIMNPTSGEILPMITAYKYDQLQRLKEARSFTAHDENKWLPEVYNNKYYNSFSYDANGNINSQIRHDHSGNQIDNLTYKYHDVGGKRKRNRLYHVLDGVDPDAYLDDIDKQKSTFNEPTNGGLDESFVEADKTNSQGQEYKINGSNNYVYDEEGRLIRDRQERIEEIKWRVDGKIKSIDRYFGGVEKNVSFEYDAMGNRVAKHVKDNQGMLEKSTYYILDASGNVMNVYEREAVSFGTTVFKLAERNIYGSTRIGILTQEVTSVTGAVSTTFQEGDKYFEMNSHLGNVLTTVQDKRKPLGSVGGSVVAYQAYIASSGDFSGFGVSLSNRTFESSKYRYGFQGQEGDNELKGNGNSWNYKYRMHDPRLGRFFAIDPLAAKYPWYSTYSFSGNRVINAIELEGLEPEDSYLIEGNKLPADNKKTGTYGDWEAKKNAAGTIQWVQKNILDAASGKLISNDPDNYHRNLALNKEKQKILDQAERYINKNSDQINDFKPLMVNQKNKSGKGAEEKFEDDLWNSGSIFSYLRYKLNKADQRYEGAKGLKNFTKDLLVVVNTAGQIAFFVPGGQTAGGLIMGFADLAETGLDINDNGWVNGLSNGAVRWVTGKVGAKFIPEQFVGTQIYKVGYKGGVEVISEMGEEEAINYLNSQ